MSRRVVAAGCLFAEWSPTLAVVFQIGAVCVSLWIVALLAVFHTLGIHRTVVVLNEDFLAPPSLVIIEVTKATEVCHSAGWHIGAGWLHLERHD